MDLNATLEKLLSDAEDQRHVIESAVTEAWIAPEQTSPRQVSTKRAIWFRATVEPVSHREEK